MATTTNYAWETPDDTDLVKDGAAAIRTLGSSIDTTTKALNPSTTLGDIEYRSSTANTNTRLGIGTTGQILTVSGGVPTWAAPAGGGGLTLISTTTFSGSSIVLSSIPGTYKNLHLEFTGVYNNTTYPAVGVRFNADSGSNYDYAAQGSQNTSSDLVNVGSNSEFYITSGTSNSGASEKASGVLDIFNYAQTTTPIIYTSASRVKQDVNWKSRVINGQYRQAANLTSITFFDSGGNFSGGTIRLYGVN